MAATTAAVTQTRLDRLITLLDSGSTPAIRATAARQLGQIAAVRVRGEASSSVASASQARVNIALGQRSQDAAKHDRSSTVKKEEEEQAWVAAQDEEDEENEIKTDTKAIRPSISSQNTLASTSTTTATERLGPAPVYRGVDGDWEQAVFLIARVLPLLRSKIWDTRIAAAQAIEAISVAAGVWDPDLAHEADPTGLDDSVSQASAGEGTTVTSTPTGGIAALLSFDAFSLPHVLSTGKKLLSSAGNEYDLPAFTSVEERLAHAKRDMQRLGLGSMAGVDMDLGVDVEKELLNDDGHGAVAPISNGANGAANAKPTVSPPPPPSAAVTVAPPAEDEVDMSKLSARERNQLKRKRKMESKAGLSGVDVSKTRVVEQAIGPTDSSSTPGLAFKTPSGRQTDTADYLSVKDSAQGASPSSPHTPRSSIDASSFGAAVLATEAASLVVPHDTWPFELICSLLLSDLFSPAWEIRHGAALGLRELYKAQGGAGGKVVQRSTDEIKREDSGAKTVAGPPLTNDKRHAQWCSDAAIRLLCVLTLDRLSDFVFDQVVAPVRETAGQALASLLKWMDDPSFFQVHAVLLQMVTQEFLVDSMGDRDAAGKALSLSASLPAHRGVTGYAWEVRHAGLLGLRYEVLVRHDLLLNNVFEATASKETPSRDVLQDVTHLAIVCLRDGDDDVRSVAAATLLPIVDQIVERMAEVVGALLEQLWSSLSVLKDDLSSSTGGVMDLLAKLVEKPEVVKEHFVKQQHVGATALSTLIPRLYPFFRHTITSVRLAVLTALLSFLAVPSLPKDWIDEGLVRLLFQNLIVEERVVIRETSSKAWQQTLEIIVERGQIASLIGPHVPRFFSILMTPLGTPIDHTLFYRAPGAAASRDTHNVDKGILAQDLALVGVDAVIRGRLSAAQALGGTLASWPQHDAGTSTSTSSFAPLLSDYLTSTSALQKCLVSVVVQEWAERTTDKFGAEYDLLHMSPLAAEASAKLIAILETPAPATYAEMVVILQRIQRQCQGLYSAFVRDGKVSKDRVPSLPSVVDATGESRDAFTIDMAKVVVSSGYEGLMARVTAKIKPTVKPAFEDRRDKLIAEIGFYQSIKDRQDSQVAASAAAATIALRALPAKLNPVIRSVMNSVKFEENADLQRRSARAVAHLIELCRRPGARADPSDKIVKNLCAFVCQDTTQTPIFERLKEAQHGILSLTEADAAGPATGRAGSRSTTLSTDAAPITEEERQGKNIRRGAERALLEISQRFGAELFKVLPVLWQSMSTSLADAFQTTTTDADDTSGQAVIDCCTLVQVIAHNLDASLHSEVSQKLLPSLTNAIKSRFSVVRTVAAKTLAHLAECITQDVMLYVVQHIVPMLDDVAVVTNRQGAMETIAHIVRLLDLALLPYVVVLVVPVLGRMSDSDEPVRLMAANTFASLVKMVPLEAGLPDPPGFPDALTAKRQEERQFLAQLLDGRKVDAYTLPVTIRADLRAYQREGVSWMAFLAKFHLHGVLCDDMGLGKTLQSICILASKHHERRLARPDAPHLPSLIVCPPTLTSHWCHEITQYATNLRPLLYAGQPAERARLQADMHAYDCIVASYDAVRNDIDVLAKRDWLYCILDEGHAIKSAKTKTTRAVKQIRAQHRLILSGTPIQNNVLELWSLFDFLMPGFLGSEKQFMERYGRPILASRDAKVTAREHERASLALDALHKQVLPFLLRRMKEDVLADLPPKIVQDISCAMSDVQRQLYDEYMRQQNRDEFDDATLLQDDGDDNEKRKGAKQHVFQTLQYLRKLVCHPSMVFDDTKPSHRAIAQQLQRSGRSLSDIANAPKLLALKQLLHDCGIGGSGGGSGSTQHNDDANDDLLSLSSSSAGGSSAGVGVSQHRVLIFCQQRRMLDIIEQDLFRTHMPSVTYARLDGSVVAPEKRFAIVQRFNADPSIDVLLLTTSVGGLGLTLTGADTVIFVEHDWNPMKDMQAMDRAHRLGQKKVVNVYRLITRDTLEEQIMGLQRFKVNVAGNVVNQQNKTTDSMDTDQILDLFGADSGAGEGEDGSSSKSKGISQKALLASLEGIADTGDDYAGMQDWSANTSA